MRKELKGKNEQRCWSLIAGLSYAQVDSWYGASCRNLKLSILTPKNKEENERFPLFIWCCGGALQVMDYNLWIPQWVEFAKRGYIVASVEYRTSNEQPYTAALEDIKSAIRYLRAHAQRFGIDSNKVVIAGESAGGMLANLIGVYGKEKNLDVGEYLEYSSCVQGVVDFYGRTDLVTESEYGDRTDLEIARKQMLGELSLENKKRASAYLHVSEDTPPFLIFQGDRDELVPMQQSEIMYQALCEKGIPADLYVLKDAGHGTDEFYQKEILDIIDEFIQKI